MGSATPEPGLMSPGIMVYNVTAPTADEISLMDVEDNGAQLVRFQGILSNSDAASFNPYVTVSINGVTHVGFSKALGGEVVPIVGVSGTSTFDYMFEIPPADIIDRAILKMELTVDEPNGGATPFSVSKEMEFYKISSPDPLNITFTASNITSTAPTFNFSYNLNGFIAEAINYSTIGSDGSLIWTAATVFPNDQELLTANLNTAAKLAAKLAADADATASATATADALATYDADVIVHTAATAAHAAELLAFNAWVLTNEVTQAQIDAVPPTASDADLAAYLIAEAVEQDKVDVKTDAKLVAAGNESSSSDAHTLKKSTSDAQAAVLVLKTQDYDAAKVLSDAEQSTMDAYKTGQPVFGGDVVADFYRMQVHVHHKQRVGVDGRYTQLALDDAGAYTDMPTLDITNTISLPALYHLAPKIDSTVTVLDKTLTITGNTHGATMKNGTAITFYQEGTGVDGQTLEIVNPALNGEWLATNHATGDFAFSLVFTFNNSILATLGGAECSFAGLIFVDSSNSPSAIHILENAA